MLTLNYSRSTKVAVASTDMVFHSELNAVCSGWYAVVVRITSIILYSEVVIELPSHCCWNPKFYFSITMK